LNDGTTKFFPAIERKIDRTGTKPGFPVRIRGNYRIRLRIRGSALTRPRKPRPIDSIRQQNFMQDRIELTI